MVHCALAVEARCAAAIHGPISAAGAAGKIRCDAPPVQARLHHIGWARLLERVFHIDMRRCLTCGAGELKIIAAILQRAAIGKILTHLGLDPGRRPGDGRARRGSRATSERAGRAVSSSASRSAT